MNRLVHTLHVVDVAGQRVAYLLPDVPADAPELIREGIARRRITATTGRCPCGAQLRNRAQRRADKRRHARRIVETDAVHATNCPAADDVLVPLLRAWETAR